MLPFCPNRLSQCGPLTPASAPPPSKCRSDPAHSPPHFPFLPSSNEVLCGSTCFFWVVRDSCPLAGCAPWYLLPLKCIPDASMERDVLCVHLLLDHLVSSLGLRFYFLFPFNSALHYSEILQVSGMLISAFVFQGFDEVILAYKVSWLF